MSSCLSNISNAKCSWNWVTAPLLSYAATQWWLNIMHGKQMQENEHFNFLGVVLKSIDGGGCWGGCFVFVCLKILDCAFWCKFENRFLPTPRESAWSTFPSSTNYTNTEKQLVCESITAIITCLSVVFNVKYVNSVSFGPKISVNNNDVNFIYHNLLYYNHNNTKV